MRIVTGGNFDFFNGTTIKDFAGDLTAFIPDIFHFKIFKTDIVFGMDFGINSFHYFSADSSHSQQNNQAYFLHYKDFYSPNDTSKVVKGHQPVNNKYDYKVWGVHLDPIFPLLSNDFAQLYGKIHLEELATTETFTPTFGTTINDTITYGQYKAYQKQYGTATMPVADPSSRLLSTIAYRQQTFYDMYIGVGLPVSLNFKNVATLYISPTIGGAYIQLAQNGLIGDPVRRDVSTPGGKLHETKFYTLNKFQLVTTVSAINVALGGEYRTVAGNMRYFSTYIGAEISIDKLKK